MCSTTWMVFQTVEKVDWECYRMITIFYKRIEKHTCEMVSHWSMIFTSGSPPNTPQPQFPVATPIFFSSWSIHNLSEHSTTWLPEADDGRVPAWCLHWCKYPVKALLTSRRRPSGLYCLLPGRGMASIATTLVLRLMYLSSSLLFK